MAVSRFPFTHASPARPAVRARRARQLALSAALVLWQSGCYTYAPMFGGRPEPGNRVAMVISDQGRVALGSQVGSGVMRLEGDLVTTQNGEYLLNVFEVRMIGGETAHWNGERVVLKQEHVAGVLERRFSKGRTAVAVAAAVGAIGGFIVARNLIGLGGPGRENPNPTEPSEQ